MSHHDHEHHHDEHCGCGHEHHHHHDEHCGCGHEHHHHDEHCGCGHEHHHHDEHCGCGHEQHHHDEHCGCGHEHHHHDEHCGCGHEHIEIQPVEDMSILQQNMLLALHERNYLPLAQFTMSSTQEDEVYAVALAPVYLGTPDDDMQQVKQLGEQLMELSNAGLITLDYDIPIEGYPYQEYNDSALFRFFQDTVKEGSTMHGSLFDTANLELGSMAITELGIARADEMLPH